MQSQPAWAPLMAAGAPLMLPPTSQRPSPRLERQCRKPRPCRTCIMHSRRVELLKAVLLESLYLGLTNSLIMPPVRASVSTYDWSLMTSWLMLPGKGL